MLPETSSIYAILQFLEYSDPIDNITQCILWNSSKFHSLNPPQKEVIERMVDFIQFWSIQESELAQNAPRSIFNIQFWNSHTQETTFRTISNGSGPTSFGLCMKKLWLFYEEHLFID